MSSLPRKRAGGPRTTGTRGDWDITAKAPEKKPKPPTKARSTLKSTKRLDRSPIERGDSELKRTGGPAPVSAKKAARSGERDAVRKTECAMKHLGGCSGPVDTHEIVRASQMAEARYMDDVTIGLCRTHHRLDTYRITAERIGIRLPRTVYDSDPRRAVEEAAMLRVHAARGAMIEPSWWSDAERAEWEATAAQRRSGFRPK